MITRDKYLYHQIHPVKLSADSAAAFISLNLLWQHKLLLSLGVLIILPAASSVLVMRFADLEKQRASSLGRYIARYMTHLVEAVRLTGMVVMTIGAWHHSTAVIAFGLVAVLLAWCRGVLEGGTSLD